jgi:F-type H+-transporting ATPase subunit b
MSTLGTLPRAARSRLDLRGVGRVALALLPVLVASVAFASEEGGEPHERSTQLLVLAFINFGIYAYILYRFAWPAIVKYLGERRAAVVAALEAAAKASAEAEALKAEFEAKMRTLEADAAKARAEVLAIAELEAKEIVEQAKRSAERIRRDARLVADQEVARARRLLQEESAELVARAAGEIVRKNLTNDDQARLVAEFVADTGAEARRVEVRR